METTRLLDVRIIEPRLKHPSIFQAFDNLEGGENLTIINDHDPLPLFYQFQAERPGIFEWKYIEKGPETWKVAIAKIKSKGRTVADVLLENPRAVNVFKKYRIDYCCKGSRLFEQACTQVGVDPRKLQSEINESKESPQPNARAKEWPLDFLTDYIIQNHHSYVRQTSPELLALSAKVAKVHGAEHPELIDVDQALQEIVRGLTMHLEKEESLLFPAIKSLVNGKEASGYPFASVSQPIKMMEEDHEEAGEAFENIRELTGDFTAPEDACTSYRLFFDMLQGFENDLHQHVHLENNILFPKAIALEKSRSEY